MTKSTSAIMLGLALASSAASAVNFDVTITNITRGITFTPFLVTTHKPAVSLFTLGSPASPELSALAEGGDTAPLKALLKGNSRVRDVQTSSGLLGPGQSVTVRVNGEWDSRFSLAAMLLPTNDGFVSLNGVYGPFLGQTVNYEAPAYDAGSEANDELCMHIPGPMCGGEGLSPAESGEGFVHIHAGIHGIGDLPASDHDWRNPVATISIKRVP
ncbi:MAG: spondin domain-containing protein [Thiobacillaceae bacterium]